MPTIPEAVAFNEAVAAYAEHQAKARELDLDVAIAKRGGDQAAIEAAEAAKKAHGASWHTLYMAEKEAARVLCNTLGVDTQKLRWALS